MLQVLNLTKKFNGRAVVDRVSFKVDKNDIVALLGPNGAGKTTLMRLLTGFYKSNGGKIIWQRASNYVGYLPESNPLYPFLTPLEYLHFIGQLKGLAGQQLSRSIFKVIDSCQLKSVYKQSIGTLSKGFRQRVGLSAALLGDPDFLILDEPTSGLDPKQIIEFRALIKKHTKDKSIIISTHILSEAKTICDRIIIINKGKIVLDDKTSKIKNLETKFLQLTND